jgi:hypothetical protein
MMFDLKTQAVKGATVHFRCGGSAVIEAVRKMSYNPYPPLFHLTFEEGQTQVYCLAGTTEAPNKFLDIIRIDPPKFDWSTVKQGMAFMNSDGNVVWFGMNDIISKGIVWCMLDDGAEITPETFIKATLTRAPEHDIKIRGV